MTTSSAPQPNPPLEPDSYTSRLQYRATIWPGMLFLVLLVALGALAVLFATGQLAFRPSSDTPEGAILEQKEMAKKNMEFASQADSAVNAVTWDKAQANLVAAQGHHQRILESKAKLNKELTQLGESIEGKRIASRDEWVDQFIVIKERNRLTDDELATQLRTIKTLLPICQQALKEKIVIPCDERFLEQVSEAHETLSEAARELDEDLRNLEILVASSQAASPAKQTLSAAAQDSQKAKSAQALVQFTQERERQQQEIEKAAQDRQLAIERDLLESKKAAADKIRRAEADREKADQTILVLEAEAKSKRAEGDLKTLQKFQEAERLRRERVAKFEAALPGVKPMLTPFISAGKMHYVPGKGWREGEPGPLSLQALQSTGGLKDEPGSHSVLVNFLLGGGSANDRPLGSFPTWRPEAGYQIQREVQRVQAFLRDYGDLLVERGMLQP